MTEHALVELTDDFDIAPNWKLVWWRFKRHKLAMVSAVVLIVIALIALFPDFFSTQQPQKTSARESFMPVQGIHWFSDEGFGPYTYSLQGKRNTNTLKMEWIVDPDKHIDVDFFVRGYEYSVFGLFKTDWHLLGPAKPGVRNRIHLLGTDRLGT